MRIIFIRHGRTKGNTEKRYIGATDEDLCTEGISELKGKKYPYAERIIVSPMKRCLHTADIIYPNRERVIENDLRECDFGDFENKNHIELSQNTYYQKWIESMGKMPFPNGENHEDFKRRCQNSFERIIERDRFDSIAFVIHGGSIMAILEKFAGGDFYDWHIENGAYLCFELKNRILNQCFIENCIITCQVNKKLSQK